MHDKELLQGRQWRWAHRTSNVDCRSCDAATFCCEKERQKGTRRQPLARRFLQGVGRQKRAYLLYSLGHVLVRFVRKNQSKGSGGAGLQIGTPYFLAAR